MWNESFHPSVQLCPLHCACQSASLWEETQISGLINLSLSPELSPQSKYTLDNGSTRYSSVILLLSRLYFMTLIARTSRNQCNRWCIFRRCLTLQVSWMNKNIKMLIFDISTAVTAVCRLQRSCIRLWLDQGRSLTEELHLKHTQNIKQKPPHIILRRRELGTTTTTTTANTSTKLHRISLCFHVSFLPTKQIYRKNSYHHIGVECWGWVTRGVSATYVLQDCVLIVTTVSPADKSAMPYIPTYIPLHLPPLPSPQTQILISSCSFS